MSWLGAVWKSQQVDAETASRGLERNDIGKLDLGTASGIKPVPNDPCCLQAVEGTVRKSERFGLRDHTRLLMEEAAVGAMKVAKVEAAVVR